MFCAVLHVGKIILYRSQILDMWLPHGLPNSEDTAKIQSIMRLSNPLTGGQVTYLYSEHAHKGSES